MKDRDKERIFDMLEGGAWGFVAGWVLVALGIITSETPAVIGRYMVLSLWWPLLWASLAAWFGRLRSAAFWRQFGGRHNGMNGGEA